jgi:mono/diheme cytochrome c family protein
MPDWPDRAEGPPTGGPLVASRNPGHMLSSTLGDDGMITSKFSGIIALAILLLSAPALAQPDTRRGFSLARENCAQCHAIDNASESPLATAPPFRELHLKYAISDLQRPLTQGPHTRFHFEPRKSRPDR